MGQRYAWAGNRRAGRGTMEVLEAEPTHARVAVSFVQPFRSSSVSSFTLTPDAAGRTEVTWTMEGQQNALMALVGRVYPMDKMIGPDFEKGLARLRTAATAAPA